ncbi:MAG TPA: sugar phosphate isomerase/epimerase family protein [Thermomicrobiales bacterium]|nr:sugar phosphate isomerase/epimerase family protein [Thermomicrobiales bacterium]
MLLSCAEQLLADQRLSERLRLIQAAGFDGIDVRWATVIDPAARREIAAHDLPVGAVYGQLRDPGLLSRTAAERASAIDGAVERAEVAAELGATALIIVPIFREPVLRGFSPIIGTEDLETAVLLASLDELAARVADLPVKIVLEPLNRDQTHFLLDPAHGAVLCDALDSPLIATMVDTYHCEKNGQDIPAAIAATGAQLALVHLSDTDRGLPGEGRIDFGSVLAALRAHGYEGWMGFECRKVDQAESLRRSVDFLRDLWMRGAAKDE